MINMVLGLPSLLSALFFQASPLSLPVTAKEVLTVEDRGSVTVRAVPVLLFVHFSHQDARAGCLRF